MNQSMMKALLKKMNKDYGDGAAHLLKHREVIDYVSTGSVSADYIIGPYCPGWPLGKLSQIFGGEKSGKSMLMCHTIREAQKRDLPVFLVDRENHYTADWVARFGADPSLVGDLWPESIEQAFGMLDDCVTDMEKTGQVGGLFIIDSLSALLPDIVFKDDSPYSEGLASAARYLSSRLGKHVARIWKVKLGVIVVGQIRIDPSPYSKDYTPGGKALEHFSVLRLRSRFKGELLEEDPVTGDKDRIGFTTELSTDKNNVGGKPSGQSIRIDFSDWGRCDDTSGLLKMASKLKLIESHGAGWYSSEKLGLKKFRGKGDWPKLCTPELVEKIVAMAFDPNIVLPKSIGATDGISNS